MTSTQYTMKAMKWTEKKLYRICPWCDVIIELAVIATHVFSRFFVQIRQRCRTFADRSGYSCFARFYTSYIEHFHEYANPNKCALRPDFFWGIPECIGWDKHLYVPTSYSSSISTDVTIAAQRAASLIWVIFFVNWEMLFRKILAHAMTTKTTVSLKVDNIGS